MAALFDYQLNKKMESPEDKKVQAIPSFTPRQDEDGALTVVSGNAYNQYIDIDGTIKNDSDLITRYRSMSDHPALSIAITSIVNEAIVNEPEQDTLSLDLSKVEDMSESLKEKIDDEFKNVLQLYNFELNGYEIFRRWYVDGRIYYHALIDSKSPANGIQELRYIDPRKIRKIREVNLKPRPAGEATDVSIAREFYLFNENGFSNQNVSNIAGANGQQATNNVKISKDAIIHATSGLMDASGKTVISYLHKAIRPLNMLTMLEDAVVIYRLSRAPERRVFYVDVGGMQKAKAEQYLNSLITNMKNKVVYDSENGTVRDQRKFSTMFEDIWLPRRGDKGTQVDTLPGGENLGKIEDVEYMQARLYQALEVPISRLSSDDTYSLGRATEISREEIAFEKFVTRLRSRFSLMILNTLRLQLLLKKVISPDDWQKIHNKIQISYNKDNLFAELKFNEVMSGRIDLLNSMMPFVGRYFSDTNLRKTVLRQTDTEILEMDKEIAEDRKNVQYLQPLDDMNATAPAGGPPGD